MGIKIVELNQQLKNPPDIMSGVFNLTKRINDLKTPLTLCQGGLIVSAPDIGGSPSRASAGSVMQKVRRLRC